MDCSWIKTLRGLQVRPLQGPEQFMAEVVLEERPTWALTDMLCRVTLMKRAPGPW